METWIPVEWVDEQLGGREEEVDGGKADHLGPDGFRSIGLGLEWQYQLWPYSMVTCRPTNSNTFCRIFKTNHLSQHGDRPKQA